MKAVIATQELLKKLTDMVSFAGRNDTMPILSHLLLQADGTDSHVRATDLSEAIFEPIALTASVAGSVCIPAKKLLDIIKELEGDLVLGMNAKYLVDALAAAQTERVEVRLGDALSPVLIAEEGKDDFTAVVMPMRL